MKIVVQFIGGFKDGCVLCSDSLDSNESQQAVFYFMKTNNGTQTGHRFKMFSDVGLKELGDSIIFDGEDVRLWRETATSNNHVYEAVKCEKDDEKILIVYEYQGQM
ncbi:MAG: hypothetical protein KDB00_13890 [Planctomycetales bacterium]|nr:hypothetical protein [Planctomycetales bacterium]